MHDNDTQITQPDSPILQRAMAVTDQVYALTASVEWISHGAADCLRAAARAIALSVLVCDWLDADYARSDLEVMLHDARRIGLVPADACEQVWDQLRALKALLHCVHRVDALDALAA